MAALDMGVLHQGSLYTVTAPAALFVAAILDHPVGLAEHEGHFPWDDGPPRSLRAAPHLARSISASWRTAQRR
ncbi:hypothetical protein [Streptomyces sp. NPDC090022]|uniref:hypothetical protein n=1 Tax=Streptomyces sp. NPDC090022 TaxID=3365920 RepID=UPI0037F63E4D